jgi:hypothetical protein
LGEVQLKGDQSSKLKAKNRENLLGAMYQTLSDPLVITGSRKGKKIYVKTFSNPKGINTTIAKVFQVKK